MSLPVRRMVLYKHGVGFIERGKKFKGNEPIKLKFKKKEMDDILKSLSIFDTGNGRVTGVSYETAEDITAKLAEKAITVPDREAMLGLFRQLRGYEVKLNTTQEEVQGIVVGTQEDPKLTGEGELVEREASVIIKDADNNIKPIKADDIVHFNVLSSEAFDDLDYFLDAITTERKKNIKGVTVFLDGKDHDVSVNYIVSMPSWRVSYRIAFNEKKTILQGWGIIDNQLDEDLKDINLSLVAGKPISFIYDIYTPRIVPRPVVREEVRTVSAPVDLEGGMDQYEEDEMEMMKEEKCYDFEEECMDGLMADEAPMAMKKAMSRSAGMGPPAGMSALMSAPAPEPTPDMLQESARVQTRSVEMGEFFKYDIETPVTVKRGQSAMVPILQCGITCEKEHVYNASKMPLNPVVTMKVTNDTGAVLERGPILVLDDGTYVGEAILPYTTNGSVNHIAYSVDLGVEVKEEYNSGSELEQIEISNRYFRKIYMEWKETTYKVTNKKKDKVDLVIEHPKSSYEIDEEETVKPTDETDNYYRWKFKVKGKKTSDFTVRETTITHYTEYIRDSSTSTVEHYYKSKYISKANYDKIQEIMELQAKIHKLEEEADKLDEEREDIYEEQERLRENLESLGDTKKEDTLRAKYVDKMDSQEGRLEAIKKREKAIEKQVEKIDDEIDKKVDKLRDDGGPLTKKPKNLVNKLKRAIKR